MLGSYFMNAYNREIKFFENCMEKVISQNEKEQALAGYFLEAGYLFIGEGNEYIVPTEVKELYQKVNTDYYKVPSFRDLKQLNHFSLLSFPTLKVTLLYVSSLYSAH